MLPYMKKRTHQKYNEVVDTLDNNGSLLRDIHIAMIGDSLMRFQYLSLAYRLRYGKWFDDSQWYYHLVNEKSFLGPFHKNDWGEFMFHTNGLLQPNEVCDCRRRESSYKHWAGTMIETRYFYDPILNNSLVFINACGHTYPPVGRLRPNETSGLGKEWHDSAFMNYSTYAWLYGDWADLIRHHIVQLDPQPRLILFNTGYWGHKFGSYKTSGNPTRETRMMAIVKNEFPHIKFIWKTTTYSNTRYNHNLACDQLMCDFFPPCVNVSFTRRVRLDLYWDGIHFYEPVYRAVNEEMLELFGYLPKNYERMNITEIF